MPTLQQILESDLGAEEATLNKEASQVVGEPDEIEKLAMEIGIVEDNAAPAAGDNNNQGQPKEAKMGLDALYTGMFGEEVAPAAVSEKTAALNKEAAEVEEAMGKMAYDSFQQHVELMVTKMAEEKIADGSAVDAEPVQALENNRAGEGGKPIDTKAVSIDNEIKPENGQAVVGAEKAAAEKLAAYRKHLLLTQIEKA